LIDVSAQRQDAQPSLALFRLDLIFPAFGAAIFDVRLLGDLALDLRQVGVAENLEPLLARQLAAERIR
jgi:hypothetical protein